MKINRLNWDSKLFGYEVGRLTLSKYDVEYFPNTDELNNFKLVYIFSDIPLNDNNFTREYVKVTYSKKISDNEDSKREKDINIENSINVLTPSLIRLTYQSGAYSRFKLDSNFKQNEFEKLYLKWLENSINGSIADYVFVAEVAESQTRGFVTLDIEGKNSTIGLIAVDEKCRGMGIGTMLLNKVETKSIEKGCDQIFVSTQLENVNACNFYERNGFEKMEIKYIYHLWNKE